MKDNYVFAQGEKVAAHLHTRLGDLIDEVKMVGDQVSQDAITGLYAARAALRLADARRQS